MGHLSWRETGKEYRGGKEDKGKERVEEDNEKRVFEEIVWRLVEDKGGRGCVRTKG